MQTIYLIHGLHGYFRSVAIIYFVHQRVLIFPLQISTIYNHHI